MWPGCRTAPSAAAPAGDEIVVAGRRFATGTRVVTWHEPGGYNGYAVKPAHHGRRTLGRAKAAPDARLPHPDWPSTWREAETGLLARIEKGPPGELRLDRKSVV